MSFTYQNLPGVQVVTVDGGLAAVNTPTDQSVLILGTSAIGPANSPYQVVSQATAAQVFGLNGTLTRAMSEVGAYCDNVYLYRIGTAQGTLSGIGATTSGSETLGSATAATYSSGSISFTFNTPLPDDAVVGALLTTTGFTPSGYNVTSSAITSVNTSTGVIKVASSTVSTESVLGTGSIAVPTAAGYSVVLGQVDTADLTRYQVWYNDGLLSIWLDGSMVYSNDPAYNVNTGDCTISGTAVGGLPINNSVSNNPDTIANALTITQLLALSPTSQDLVPVYVAPQTGIGLTNRQLYIAQQNAMNILQGFPVDFVYTPNVITDNPNVAYYVSSNSATATNNPATNANALDWLWTGVDYYGNPCYQWASETVFWDYNTVSHSSLALQGNSSPVTATTQTFTTPTPRLAAGVGSGNVQQNGFHEVHFPYQLARFCEAAAEAPQADHGGCFGFIGTSGPVSLSNFNLSAIRTWIGVLPVYSALTGVTSPPTTSGTGLLGIPLLVGATAGSLNAACTDAGTGRTPGLYLTISGEYDGGAQIDANGYKVDIGAYIAVQGDYCLMSNNFGTYVGNIAGVMAGLTSSLDQQKALTNKQVAGVQQLYRASLNQLDSLTQANINMLRYKGVGSLPVTLHDKTAANAVSDYIFTLRQRIKFLVVQTLLEEADNYIGNSTTDGLTLTSLKTALDADLLNLQKRGYLSSYNFTITSTLAQQKIGQASIQVSFVPANELVQLNATVGINLNQ
jgi:hypothetical protein